MPANRKVAQAQPADVPVNGEGQIPPDPVVETALSTDPLNLSSMRINPAKLATIVGVKAAHIRVGRPDDQDFFQVHGGDGWVLDTYLLRMKNDREFYFVAADLWAIPSVAKELKLYRLYYYSHYSRALGLWPVQLPAEDGTQNSWHESAMYIAQKAIGHWTRLLSGVGGYSTIAGEMEDEPVWPAMDFQEVIRTAFRPKTITELDHPKLKQLRGEKK
jgi:hypothetical protein